ncbi:MAG: hypothetical protein HY823_01385 [Acidobacteria bacterium]|nr:hypothetical protein [Acidobacteriota bacterium]
MFRRVEDFRDIWKAEVAKTTALLGAIPSGALGQAVAPEHRDLRRLAWHIVESAVEMPLQVGLKLPGFELKDGHLGAPPEDTGSIIAAYTRAAEALDDCIGGWNNAELGRSFNCYGEQWSGGFLLYVLVAHQVHHRGQMTVLLRQAGLPLPEIYGPTKEGWGAYGMEAPAV